MRNWGLNPIIGGSIFAIMFVAVSMIIFRFTQFASYFYIAISIILTFKLSTQKRNDFLKICFCRADYYKVRLVENALSAIPFVLFLFIKSQFCFGVMLVILSAFMIFVCSDPPTSITIPTPFGKYPHEFCVGFRSSIIFIVIAYYCSVMAVIHDNANVGIASLALLHLAILSFYIRLEPPFYIWSFAMTPSRFLIVKIKTAWIYAIALTSPVVLTVAILAPHKIIWLLITSALGMIFTASMIVAKYSSYPNEIGVPSFIIIIISFTFPPILLLSLPLFYSKSVRKLNQLSI